MKLKIPHYICLIAALALCPCGANAAGWTFISVKSTIGSQLGAKGNGIDDDTAAINRAINALNSSTATTVYFPPGTYRYIGQMPLAPLANRSYRFYGDGPGVSIIQFEGSSAGINVPSIGRENLNVEGLTLKTNTANCGTAINAFFGPHASPSPAAIKFHTATIHNVQIMGSAKNENSPGYWTKGIRLYRAQNSVIDKVEISGTKNFTQTGIALENEPSGVGENATGFQVSNIAVKWCNTGLLMNGWVEGLYLTGFEFFSCGRNELPSISLNGSGITPGAFQMVNGLVETVGGGLHMSNFNFAKVSNVTFKHNPASEVPPYSHSTMLSLDNVSTAVISECSFYGTSINGPAENGIFLQNATAVQITGNYFTNINSSGAGSGIVVLANNSVVRITDNVFTPTVPSRINNLAGDTYFCGNHPTNNCGSTP